VQAFVVARPSSSKSNYPLNIQVQLVPPNTRDHDRSTSSRHSNDSLTTNPELEGQPPLTRTSSNHSDVSTYSDHVPSVTSVNSFGSTALTRRMIIPLYNLQAHNVMTSVFLDARVDARHKVSEARSQGGFPQSYRRSHTGCAYQLVSSEYPNWGKEVLRKALRARKRPYSWRRQTLGIS